MPGRLPFQSHSPSQQFRYRLQSSKLPNAGIYCKSATLPKVNNNEVRVDILNHYFKMKGKSDWDNITLTCYAYEGITAQEVYDYFNNAHQGIELATDYRSFMYKHNLDLIILNPKGEDSSKWTMKGAFVSSISWGNVDWGNDGVIEIQIVIAYDYAKYESL